MNERASIENTGTLFRGILLVVTVPVKQLGLRFELGNLNGKLGCSKLEEVDYLLGKIFFFFKEWRRGS